MGFGAVRVFVSELAARSACCCSRLFRMGIASPSPKPWSVDSDLSPTARTLDLPSTNGRRLGWTIQRSTTYSLHPGCQSGAFERFHRPLQGTLCFLRHCRFHDVAGLGYDRPQVVDCSIIICCPVAKFGNTGLNDTARSESTMRLNRAPYNHTYREALCISAHTRRIHRTC
jgi:hypothetical protein